MTRKVVDRNKLFTMMGGMSEPLPNHELVEGYFGFNEEE